MEWIKFEDEKPEKGQRIKVKYIPYRYGVIKSEEEEEGIYLGMNTIIGKPMVDFECDYDDCYLELTHWKL